MSYFVLDAESQVNVARHCPRVISSELHISSKSTDTFNCAMHLHNHMYILQDNTILDRGIVVPA